MLLSTVRKNKTQGGIVMANKDKYPIPLELVLVYERYQAYSELKEDYVNKKFGGFRKAVKCGRKAKRSWNKFWSKVHKLYPELGNKVCQFQSYSNEVIICKD